MPPAPALGSITRAGWRRSAFFTLVILTTLLALGMITSAFLQNGLTPTELILLVLYTLLILWISTSFWTATLGFLVLLLGGDRRALARLKARSAKTPGASAAKAALVMPIYNEDPVRVFAGLRAIWQDLEETGQSDRFELFVLSDTRDPQGWMQEEAHWYQMCLDFNAHGRLFYRNRERNLARKSGNIEDFCQRWGGRYEYMIVLDADSLMAGETLVQMAELMDRHPEVALIQSPPLPANQHSLFSRILQFASSFYGDLFIAGINFWQLSESGYWGHNAIIRIKPFVEHCGLPTFPGREPFGGEIFSHDTVEAALLRQAGYEVWIDPMLKGSYEELPPTLIDYAKRDRRWCQGNLQHLRLIFAKGFSGLSRLYFLMGIMSYVSSPLWLLFLGLTGFEAYVKSQTMPVYFFGDNLFPVWPESYAVEMKTVLWVTLSMLFLPKLWSLLLAIFRWRELRLYGGVFRAGVSVLFESLFSMLTAPVLMLYQSKFVVSILLRKSVGWPAQNRDEHRLSLWEAVQAHGEHTLIGLFCGWISYQYVPGFFFWLVPVLAGLVLSIPLSMLSSSAWVGGLMRRLGLFLTPAETQPPRVLCLLEQHLEVMERSKALLTGMRYSTVRDPGVSSLHLALLPQKPLKKRQRHQLRALFYQVVEEGADKLSAADRRSLIADPESLSRLHTLSWTLPEA